MSKNIMKINNKTYTFNISLSVLNHLGRNLYRNFVTVLGEAISNSWDADAKNVWIEIDKSNGNFIIKDDGVGMTSDDFENKFLKIGYSKRKSGSGKTLKMHSSSGRPYIGAKGIGKLALLSCADIISVISKTSNTDYAGGAINNSKLGDAIEDDSTPDEYELGKINMNLFDPYTERHTQGTIIHFKGFNQGIRKTIHNLKKLLALYFRFSLVDDNFNIHLNGKKIVVDDLHELSEKTEFLWNISNFQDPFTNTFNLDSAAIKINSDLIKGFIATVNKPRDLKITNIEEKVGIDLFVNGRLRERDLLKHIPSGQIPESYMYGQIHCDVLDTDRVDRFTSGREGVLESDEIYQSLLSELKGIIKKICDPWDSLRLARGEDGDDENKRKSKDQRRVRSLLNLKIDDLGLEKNSESEKWIGELRPDAEFNISSYTECFLSENLLRKYISEKKINIRDDNNYKKIKERITGYKKSELSSKKDAGINIDIRKNTNDSNYLGMSDLINIIEESRSEKLITKDGKEYRPIRNALMHTALLTEEAKTKLKTVYDNIKAGIKKYLDNS